MKICVYCGARNFDIQEKCSDCGAPFVDVTKKLVVRKPSSVAVASKIFLIMNIVLWGLCFLLSFVLWLLSFGEGNVEIISSFIFMIATAVRTIVNVVVFLQYNRKIKDGEIVGVGFRIFTVLFVSFIAGLLMFCDNNANNAKDTQKQEPTLSYNVQNTNNKVNEMKQFKELLDVGIITQEEFEKKKKEILSL